MTVAIDTARVAYSGSGSTGPFTIPFYFLDNSHIRAIVKDADGDVASQVFGLHWTASAEL